MIKKFKMFTESLLSDNIEEITFDEYTESYESGPEPITNVELDKLDNIFSELSDVLTMANFVRMDSNSFGFDSYYPDDGMSLHIHDYWLYIMIEHAYHQDHNGNIDYVEYYHRVDIADGYDNIADYITLIRDIIKKSEH
jgi:hypothetical protein